MISFKITVALANLGVNADNKIKIAEKGGIPKLIHLAKIGKTYVMIEAVAALANLAVNGELDKTFHYFLFLFT
jgi:hypothetical protein